jgi:predicted RNase H-like nuclease (RuvC/YqgF family)
MSEFIKECLAKEPTVVVPEEPEAPKVSEVDLAALKKQVVRLQTQNQSLKDMNAEASDEAEALYTLLTHFHETDTDIFYQMMTHLKISNASVHERQLKNFEENT